MNKPESNISKFRTLSYFSTAELLGVTLSLLLMQIPAVLSAEVDAQPAVTSEKSAFHRSLTELLNSSQDLTLFTRALQKSSVWKLLETAEIATVFVPSDQAMQLEGSAFLLKNVLVAEPNGQRLDELMAHHTILDGSFHLDAATQSQMLVSLAEGCIPVEVLDNAVKIGPEAFHVNSYHAANGVIHVIDRLLWQSYENGGGCSAVE